MRKILFYGCFLLVIIVLLGGNVLAESIHFGDYIYKPKSENQYYKENESPENWTSKIDVFYYPEISNPLKYAADEDKRIEDNEKCVLLKFVQNKKQSIALISYLENGIERDGNFFAYNIYKYQKHPKKGIVVMRYVKKYMFNSNEEISKIGQEIRQINNDYMERMIITDIPIEKENKEKDTKK